MPNSNDKNSQTHKSEDGNSGWHFSFPKYAELFDEVPEHSYEGWFDKLPVKIYSSELSLECFEQMESQFAALSCDAWNSLKSKVLQQVNSRRRELISLFNEAAGYVHLKNALSERDVPFDSIRQPVGEDIRGGIAKQPEWVAIHGRKVIAALEVKTIFESDVQTEFIESNTQRILSGQLPRVRRLYPSLPDGLFRKLKLSVGIAKSQLRAIAEKPALLIVYVIVNFDIEVAHAADCKGAIQDFLREMNEDDIEVYGDLRSPYL